MRGTPQEYLCEIGSWELLEGQLLCRNIHRVFILHGLSHGKRQNRIFRRFKSNSCFENYGGVCTDQRVQELEAQVLDNHLEYRRCWWRKSRTWAKPSTQNGVTGNYFAHFSSYLCTVHAIECNREDGAMERYDVFPQANALVLVEPRVLLHSPRS